MGNHHRARDCDWDKVYPPDAEEMKLRREVAFESLLGLSEEIWHQRMKALIVKETSEVRRSAWDRKRGG
jgi:hypothetical protein